MKDMLMFLACREDPVACQMSDELDHSSYILTAVIARITDNRKKGAHKDHFVAMVRAAPGYTSRNQPSTEQEDAAAEDASQAEDDPSRVGPATGARRLSGGSGQ